MFDQMPPGTAMRWLVVIALVYLIWPIDLIPDRAGLVGRIDDLLLIAWLAWANRGRIRELVRQARQQPGPTGDGQREHQDPRRAGRASGERTEGASRSRSTGSTFDPHAVLGVARGASSSEIRAAYRARMQEYHPDKVAHLGAELQKVAHEKSQEIQRAYRALRD